MAFRISAMSLDLLHYFNFAIKEIMQLKKKVFGQRFILRTAGTSETACSCKHTVKETGLIDIPTPVNGFKLIIKF